MVSSVLDSASKPAKFASYTLSELGQVRGTQ